MRRTPTADEVRRRYTAVADATKQICEVLRQHAPAVQGITRATPLDEVLADAPGRMDGRVSLEWARGGGVNATLRATWEQTHVSGTAVEGGGTLRAQHYALRVEVTWSSGGGHLASAVAATHLHQQVIQVAALVEHVGRDLHVADVEVAS